MKILQIFALVTTWLALQAIGWAGVYWCVTDAMDRIRGRRWKRDLPPSLTPPPLASFGAAPEGVEDAIKLRRDQARRRLN